MIDRCGKRFVAILIAFVGLVSSGSALAQISFTVSLPQTLVDAPVTGRLIVVATAQSEDAAAKVEPRQMTGMNGPPALDRKSVVWGKRVPVRVDLCGRRIDK